MKSLKKILIQSHIFLDFNYKKYDQVLSSGLVSFSKSQRALKQLYLVYLKEKFFLKLMKCDFL